MRRFFHIVGLSVAVLWLMHGGTAFAAETRIALVIGNGGYEMAPLANPVNDARLMAETLRGLGFEVIERIDADQKEMKVAIFELGDRLEDAGKDAVGLFYYAGHGVQVNGENYLIPLGAKIERERHVAIEAVGASWVLGQMEFAGNRVNFVILDACRNNPLTRGFRSQLQGLARMNAPTGSLVAYSTGPGDVAVDGDGANSPYTLALAQAMLTPNLPAEKMFKLVRNAVREATKGKQTPWEESSMTGGDFFFNLDAPVTVDTPATPTTSGAAATTQQETVFWQSIENSADAASFEAYLAEYPNGKFAALARLRINRLEEQRTAAVVPPPAPAPRSSAQPAVGVYPQAYKPGETFSDCGDCPEMVVVPAGSFTMGSPSHEEGREENEGPQHEVTIPRPFAVGVYEVTRGEFARFVSETGYYTGDQCYIYEGGDWAERSGRSWRDPNFSQTDRDPVLCVDWRDAQAYVSWLGHTTGKSYRLLSEAEWEYAARAGTQTRYWYGDDDDDNRLCGHGNGAGRETDIAWKNEACADGYARTAPVGAFRANGFGLHDVHGNVGEWVEDCWHETYAGAPVNGRAWTSGGECGRRVLRGGSWIDDPWYLRAAKRDGSDGDSRDDNIGFRVARTLSTS